MAKGLHKTTLMRIFRVQLKTETMTQTTYRTSLGLRNEPYRFISRETAFDFSSRTVKASRVILGSDNRFWVVCPADATRLEKLGFEYAN